MAASGFILASACHDPIHGPYAVQARLVAAGVYTVDGDINDRALLASLFGMCSFSHVLHLAAQVRRDPRRLTICSSHARAALAKYAQTSCKHSIGLFRLSADDLTEYPLRAAKHLPLRRPACGMRRRTRSPTCTPTWTATCPSWRP